jgi:hypothetical protein
MYYGHIQDTSELRTLLTNVIGEAAALYNILDARLHAVQRNNICTRLRMVAKDLSDGTDVAWLAGAAAWETMQERINQVRKHQSQCASASFRSDVCRLVAATVAEVVVSMFTTDCTTHRGIERATATLLRLRVAGATMDSFRATVTRVRVALLFPCHAGQVDMSVGVTLADATTLVPVSDFPVSPVRFHVTTIPVGHETTLQQIPCSGVGSPPVSPAPPELGLAVSDLDDLRVDDLIDLCDLDSMFDWELSDFAPLPDPEDAMIAQLGAWNQNLASLQQHVARQIHYGRELHSTLLARKRPLEPDLVCPTWRDPGWSPPPCFPGLVSCENT